MSDENDPTQPQARSGGGTGSRQAIGAISPNEANISEISEREINLYLSRHLSVHPERIQIRASERVGRSRPIKLKL